MGLTFILRSAVIAYLLALLCVYTVILGAILSLAAGGIALMLQPRRIGATSRAESTDPSLWPFLRWYVCVGLFAAFIIALSPFEDFPPITIAFLMFSPLFGTMVLLIEAAAMGAIQHEPHKN